ncbi:MAG: PAS domain S-box protein, partial [Phycisphaerales bacterium]
AHAARLRESHQQLRALFDVGGDAMIVFDRESLRITDCNPAAEALFGRPREDLLRLSVDSPEITPVYQSEGRQSGVLIHAEVRALSEGARVVRREWTHLRANGAPLIAEVSLSRMRRGGREHVVAAIRDVTERVAMERDVRESRERLQRILQHMPVLLDAIDERGMVCLWNAECERVTGWSSEEIVGNPRAFELLYPDPDYRERMLREWRCVRGSEYRDWEWEITCKDGSKRIVAWSNMSGQHPIEGWCDWGTGVDVTEQRRTEAALRDSERRHRELFESSRDGISVTDNAGRMLHMNEAAAEVLGYPRETLLTMNVADLRAPEGAPTIAEQYESYTRVGARIGEFRLLRPDGAVRIVEYTARRVDDDTHMTILRDVTERRAAEEERRVAIERFECVVKATEDVVWDWDLTTDTIEWSEAFTRVYGYEETVLKDATAWVKEHIHPDDRERIERSVFGVFKSDDNHWESEYRWRRADGTHAVVYDRGYVIRDEHGRPTRMIGAMIDFTQRRAAEQSLRESESRFRAMADSSPMMIWVSDEACQCVYFNRACIEFTGCAPESLLGRRWMERVHPGDLERTKASLERSWALRERFTVEYRSRRHDGEYRWLLDSGAPRYLDDGSFAGFVGSCTDITERKRSEEHLRLLNRELNHRVKNNLAAIQVLAERTAACSPTLDAFRASFAGRVGALARMHDLMMRTPGEATSLRAVIDQSLEAYIGGGESDVRSVGASDVYISKSAASTLHMILHELATNAVKHGALARPAGSIVVDWQASDDDAPMFRLTWTEHGCALMEQPGPRGFGMEFIEGLAAHELGGGATWDFAADGLRCVIDAPLSSVVAATGVLASRFPASIAT